MRYTISVAAVALLATVPLPSRTGAAAAQSALPLPLRLDAFAVNMGTVGPGAAGMIDMRVTRWSTEADRTRIIETMIGKGQDALLRLLQDLPSVGRLRFPNLPGPDRQGIRLGWDIRYSRVTPLPEGGHRIILALDRTMSFLEVTNQPRTVDYPFTLIQIHLNKNLEGEGKLALGTKITFDKKKKVVELENYSSEPVRLNTVKASKG